MKHSVVLLEIIVFLFFIIVELSLYNINNNLVQITNAMVEQNAILKFNPNAEE